MKHHSINYVEFPSQNLRATKEFYWRVFDWKFTDIGPRYSSFAGAGIDGGFYYDESDVRGHLPLIIIYSDNLNVTEQNIISAGGSISKQAFTFPGGKRFHFRDPTGNELAVWSQ